jgi:hypothetical protein
VIRTIQHNMACTSTARHAIHLQFDIIANALEI